MKRDNQADGMNLIVGGIILAVALFVWAVWVTFR